MKRGNQKGSVLVLVVIAAIILSLLGVAGLTSSSTELMISRNFSNDKSGINFGINELRGSIDPTSVSFLQSLDNSIYKSGSITQDTAQYVTAFQSIPAPPPQGVSMEVGGDAGIVATSWDLLVSSEYKTGSKNTARKEIRSVILIMSTEY